MFEYWSQKIERNVNKNVNCQWFNYYPRLFHLRHDIECNMIAIELIEWTLVYCEIIEIRYKMCYKKSQDIYIFQK